MSKVIRIGKAIFSRLQQIGEPLVDTPSSVIEKLLDHYESCGALSNKHHRDTKVSPVRNSQINPGAFLLPGSQENVQETIASGKPISLAKEHLTPEEFNKFEQSLGGKREFRCWAMTSRNRNLYDKMKVGDWVFFTPSKTGYFTYSGSVIYKLKSNELQKAIWMTPTGKPWELIFLVKDITKINVPKSKLLSIFGFSSKDNVQSVRYANPSVVQEAISTGKTKAIG